MRANAHVDERLGVAIGTDRATGAHLGGVVVVGLRRFDPLDDLDLVRLISEELLGLVHRHLGAHERLIRLHDLAHLGLDSPEVVVAERGAVRQFEVVVEAVLDGRADRELGAWEQPRDGLGHHVCGRVTQDVPALGCSRRDDRHGLTIVERSGEVGLLAVDDSGDGRLLQAGADGGGQIERSGVSGQFAFGAVGERDRDVRHATDRIGPATTVRREGLCVGPISCRRRA